MINRPFDQIRDVFKENNQKGKELLKYVFEKSDALSLWIIGLSAGGISIIATNVINIKKSICPTQLYYILLLLSISVAAGIIYRILFLYWFVIQNHISDEINIAFSREKQMHQKSYLSGNETFEELVFVVQDSTGIDYTHLIPMFHESEENNKLVLYDSLVKYYLNSVEFAKKDFKLAMDFVADTYSKASAISKEEFLKGVESYNSGLKAKRVFYFLRIFYALFILTFIAALYFFAESVK